MMDSIDSSISTERIFYVGKSPTKNILQTKNQITAKQGSFGKAITWLLNFFSQKISAATKEKSFTAILKSFIQYINPFATTRITKNPDDSHKASKEATQALKDFLLEDHGSLKQPNIDNIDTSISQRSDQMHAMRTFAQPAKQKELTSAFNHIKETYKNKKSELIKNTYKHLEDAAKQNPEYYKKIINHIHCNIAQISPNQPAASAHEAQQKSTQQLPHNPLTAAVQDSAPSKKPAILPARQIPLTPLAAAQALQQLQAQTGFFTIDHLDPPVYQLPSSSAMTLSAWHEAAPAAKIIDPGLRQHHLRQSKALLAANALPHQYDACAFAGGKRGSSFFQRESRSKMLHANMNGHNMNECPAQADAGASIAPASPPGYRSDDNNGMIAHSVRLMQTAWTWLASAKHYP